MSRGWIKRKKKKRWFPLFFEIWWSIHWIQAVPWVMDKCGWKESVFLSRPKVAAFYFVRCADLDSMHRKLSLLRRFEGLFSHLPLGTLYFLLSFVSFFSSFLLFFLFFHHFSELGSIRSRMASNDFTWSSLTVGSDEKAHFCALNCCFFFFPLFVLTFFLCSSAFL